MIDFQEMTKFGNLAFYDLEDQASCSSLCWQYKLSDNSNVQEVQVINSYDLYCSWM